MQKLLPLIAAGTLFLGLASGALAQDNAVKPAAPSQDPKPGAYGLTYLPGASGQPADSPQPGSLGDAARLARAKKSAEPKATRTLNDENLGQALYVAGRTAPAISFVGSDGTGGGSASSGSVGHLVLIDFWATWCGPCRHALPGLKQLVSEYRDQVEVVSVNEDKDQNAWRAFVDQNQMNWSQQFDGNRAMARRYGVSAFPTYILLDSNGKVIAQVVGEDPSLSLVDRLGPEIRSALAGKS